MAEYRYLAKPDPEWINFPHNLPPGTEIVRMDRGRKPIIQEEGLDIVEYGIPSRSEHVIFIRSYIPVGQLSLPLILYLHGGGFVYGGLETDDKACRALAKELNVSVVNVEYRLAPEHPFPCGLEDCQDVLRWATTIEAMKKLKTDLTKGFILGGTSAGGNFTAVLSHEAVIENLSPPLTGLIFIASSICHPAVRPEKYKERILSVDEVDDAPGLTRKSIDHFSKIYGAPPENKFYSPLLYDFHDRLAKKAFLQICGWDPRRDEMLLYDDILSSNGIETRKKVYPGLPHGWWTTAPSLESSRIWQRDLICGVGWLLQK